MNTFYAVCAAWGFLVGFVGWYSLFRVVGTLTRWLIPKGRPWVGYFVSVLVMLFLIWSVFTALALVPLIMCRSNCEPEVWRAALGFTHVSSVVGVLVYGFVLRANGKRGGSRRGSAGL